MSSGDVKAAFLLWPCLSGTRFGCQIVISDDVGEITLALNGCQAAGICPSCVLLWAHKGLEMVRAWLCEGQTAKKVLRLVGGKSITLVCVEVQWDWQLVLRFHLHIPQVQTSVGWWFPGIPGSASFQATTVSLPRPPIGGRPRHHCLSHRSTKPAQYHHAYRTRPAATPRRFSHRPGPPSRRHTTTARVIMAFLNSAITL